MLSDSEDEGDGVKKKPKKQTIDSDDEGPGPSAEEKPEETVEAVSEKAVVPDVSDDSDDGIDPNADRGSGEAASDFEAMLARKREEQTKRRKRKDIDIINDNDDIIAQLLSDMRNAAEVCSYIV